MNPDPSFTRLHNLGEIMMMHGRDLIAGLLVLILGLLAVKWIVRGIRLLMGRLIPKPAVAATVANVINITLLTAVLVLAAVEAGLKVQPVFRLVMVIFLCVVGLIIFFRPYIPSLPFKVGQTVKIGDMLGKVEATTFLNTRIRTFDGKVFFVPNKNILNGVVINYHYTPTRRMKIDIPIRYDQDLMKAKQLLESLMIEDSRVQVKPRPSVWVLDLSNGCVLLGGRCWAENNKYWQTRVDLIEKVKLRFDHEGILISYPHTGVHHYPAELSDAEAVHELSAGQGGQTETGRPAEGV